MGTFTLAYAAKKAFTHRNRYALYAVVLYGFLCLRRLAIEKRSMMKGQSKLFAGRRAEIEAWAKKTGQEVDIWKY